MGEPLSQEELKKRRNKIPRIGGDKEPNTFSLSRGDSINTTSSTRYKYITEGAGIGTKLSRHTPSQFRAESFTRIALAGWVARVTDVWIDVYIQEPTTREVTIDAEFDLRFAYALQAIGGRARGLGQVAIYDLSTDTQLAMFNSYNRSRRLLDSRSWSGSSQPLLAAKVRGGRTLRIGVRALSEAEAWLTAYATADTYTAEGNNRYHRTRSLNVSVRS